MPSWSAASTFASAVPRVSWKCTARRSIGIASRSRPMTSRHLRRHRDADGIADRHLVAAGVDEPARDVDDALRGPPRPRRDSRSRSRRSRARAGPRARASGTNAAKRAKDSSIEALVFWRLKVSLAAVKTAISRAPAARARSKPCAVRHEHGQPHARPACATRRRTSSEPAICGTHFGETKAPTSTTGRPASTSAVAEGDAVVDASGAALVLQAVAGADLDDGDAARQARAHSSSTSTTPGRHHVADLRVRPRARRRPAGRAARSPSSWPRRRGAPRPSPRAARPPRWTAITRPGIGASRRARVVPRARARAPSRSSTRAVGDAVPEEVDASRRRARSGSVAGAPRRCTHEDARRRPARASRRERAARRRATSGTRPFASQLDVEQLARRSAGASAPPRRAATGRGSPTGRGRRGARPPPLRPRRAAPAASAAIASRRRARGRARARAGAPR